MKHPVYAEAPVGLPVLLLVDEFPMPHVFIESTLAIHCIHRQVS